MLHIIDMKDKKILLSHGSGGKLMYQLIEEIKNCFKNEFLENLDDSATLPSFEGNEICFTTDSYTVEPIFFPDDSFAES